MLCPARNCLLGTKFVPAGIVIGAFCARSLWRARRRTLAVGAVELSLFSVALFVGLSEGLYGGPTPYSAEAAGESATGASSPGGYLDRAYRLIALFIDREFGLLRWRRSSRACFAGSGGSGAPSERLARAVPRFARSS